MRIELSVLLFSALVGPLAALHAPDARSEGPWIVIVPPWRDPGTVISRAGAREIGPSSAPWGHLVAAPSPAAREALIETGGWLVMNADFALGLCGSDDGG
ncbi:hypothetical protein LPB142_12065 [Rhodobacter xanthinilyticus]|uniref:Uncharacterized protein n=1 Tax=Rhodobacter xanthinilyticus TaxID=1850250 RepID=A0A1D9MDM5_9RHOB|nr:hypothetical protein [Rhodobacter xanthinilyticus]AOZ69967.1 hypothetical protein LPB142_12065 [Rhodobacter xanthinilyticus]